MMTKTKGGKCIFLVSGNWCEKLNSKCIENQLFSGVKKNNCHVRSTAKTKQNPPPHPPTRVVVNHKQIT